MNKPVIIPSKTNNKNMERYLHRKLSGVEEGGGSSEAVKFTEQELTDEQKAQARQNIGAGTYSKPSGGIPASDLADGVIPDTSQFVTKSVDDLLNYYLKSETYTKAEVEALIGAIQHFHYEVYPTLADVTSPSNNVLYLIGPTGSGTDKYEEYVYDPSKQEPWVKIGDTSVDLSGYVTIDALNTALANKQNTLVSGSNIKTINSNSILGGGNLKIEEPFLYVYSTSTASFNDLETAYNAGRIIFAEYQGNMYVFGSREYNTVKPTPQITITITFYSFFRAVSPSNSSTPTYLEFFYLTKATQTGQPDSIGARKTTITLPTKLSDLADDATHRLVTDTEKATWNGKYSKPNDGIPASDLANNVIPSVPDISTNVKTDKNSDTKTASPKAVYSEVHPATASSQPVGGFLPNVFYNLGELAGSVTFALATPDDATIVNHYYWTFETNSTAPTITWPSGITWYGGSAPTINPSKHYEISVLNGIGVFMEV